MCPYIFFLLSVCLTKNYPYSALKTVQQTLFLLVSRMIYIHCQHVPLISYQCNNTNIYSMTKNILATIKFCIFAITLPPNHLNPNLQFSRMSCMVYKLKINQHLVFVPEPSPLYDNNHYHEECLRCNSCGLNLTGPNQKRARRFKNQILCDLHFADVALMECSDFMQQLRSFKPQSLGCAVARRKSSTTLIFPLPPQACSGK